MEVLLKGKQRVSSGRFEIGQLPIVEKAEGRIIPPLQQYHQSSETKALATLFVEVA